MKTLPVDKMTLPRNPNFFWGDLLGGLFNSGASLYGTIYSGNQQSKLAQSQIDAQLEAARINADTQKTGILAGVQQMNMLVKVIILVVVLVIIAVVAWLIFRKKK